MMRHTVDELGVTESARREAEQLAAVDEIRHQQTRDRVGAPEGDAGQARGKDLLPIFKTRARLSEIMTKRRRLSLAMIRHLHERLAIPFEYLVQDYKLKKSPGAGRSRQR